MDAKQCYRLRVNLKKLRYSVEFFRGVYAAGSVRFYLEGIEALHENLGELNDAAVSRRLLKALADDSSGDLRRAANGLSLRLERHIQLRTRDLSDQWREFEKAKPFWV